MTLSSAEHSMSQIICDTKKQLNWHIFNIQCV